MVQIFRSFKYTDLKKKKNNVQFQCEEEIISALKPFFNSTCFHYALIIDDY